MDEAAETDLAEHELHQPLGDVEVGDRAVPHRSHGDDVTGRAPDHVPRFVPHREHVTGPLVHRDDRRLVQDDAPAADEHERVRGAQIDRDISGHQKDGRISSSPRTGQRAALPFGSLTETLTSCLP